jgi:hypothetical protein
MKLKKLVSLSGCLLALSASIAYSGTMGPEILNRTYIGVFGGGGAVTRTDVSQFGTAFFIEGEGGPLAVDSFGTAGSSGMGMVGGHIGIAWPTIMGAFFPVTPAAELEGYYIGGVELQAHDVSNDTVRLDEHDFLVTYPFNTGVFLVNAVLNSNNSWFERFRPYLGVGIGTAVLSISDATSLQTSPPESVNHYNSDTSARTIAFAAQPKIGLRYDYNPTTSVFVEYRFLYLSETSYTFGSTVAAGHAPTSPWLVKINPQYYNMGTIGVDFDL